VDAYLGGPGSTADLITVTGNVSGVTKVVVLNTGTGGGGANPDGIALVQVNGTSAAGDFVLAGGPVSAGLFTYDLQFDVGNSVHELVSTGAAAASAELATFASAAQSIWHDTLGVLDERFEELHKDMRSAAILGDGTLVQPMSDSPAVQSGLWGKVIGRISDREATSSVGGIGADISYGLDTTGLLLGADGVLEDANGSLALGVTGGYVNAGQDFDSGSTANYEGFAGGLYATYISGNFHVNAQLRANFLDLDYTMAGSSGTSDANVVSLGGTLEAGYRIDVTDTFYAEPVAQFAYADSSIRNGDVLDTAFTADGNSLRGAIGLNLGGQMSDSGMVFKPELTLKVWGEFEGDNSANFSTFTVADNTPDVFGEASLGVEALSLANGWSGNLKADVQFAEDFTSFGGFVGLRKSF
jgi:outer membrane autotransporter protein